MIVAVDGRPVRNLFDLTALLDEKAPGDAVQARAGTGGSGSSCGSSGPAAAKVPGRPRPPSSQPPRPLGPAAQVRALRGVDGGGEPEVVTVSATLEVEAQP